MPRHRVQSVPGRDDRVGVIVRDLTNVPTSAFIRTIPMNQRTTSYCRSPQTLERNGIRTVPYTPEQLAARFSIFPGCWVCGGPKESTDHVKALGIKGWDALGNMRPICRSCNASKGCRWGANLAAWLIKRRTLCGVPVDRGLFL